MEFYPDYGINFCHSGGSARVHTNLPRSLEIRQIWSKFRLQEASRAKTGLQDGSLRSQLGALGLIRAPVPAFQGGGRPSIGGAKPAEIFGSPTLW